MGLENSSDCIGWEDINTPAGNKPDWSIHRCTSYPGKLKTTSNPPNLLVFNVTVAPCCAAISRTIAKPSPFPSPKAPRPRVNAALGVERSARVAIALTEKQHANGYIDRLVLLNAQRTVYQASFDVAQAQANRLGNSAALFQALGGGWQSASNNR
jgi:hypothetical protein